MHVDVGIPAVESCGVSQCAYNHDGTCHAIAITVGDDDQPRCDTFMESLKHVTAQQTAGVGACKVGSCIHNQDLECSAADIEVDMIGRMVCCLTFEKP